MLGATNTPWELDPAVRRRFEKRIYIPLPDFIGRKVMFKIRTKKSKHTITEEEFDQLGEDTDGYSGSDITTVVKEGMMEPVRRCQTAKKFRQVEGGLWMPTFPTDPMGQEMNMMDVPSGMLKAPDVSCVSL